MLKTHEIAKTWLENAPTAPKTWGKPTQSLALQKWPPIHGKMKPPTKKCGMKTHTGSSGCLRELTWRKSGEENMKTWKHVRMAYVFGFLLSQGVKTRFPKTDVFSNSNLGCHTLPIPCNNQLNQFLAVINDWVSKTRKIFDSFDGFSLWHLAFPHWPQRFEYSPPLILRKSCPFSLLLHWHSCLWVF